ncbi:hypothetical protein Tco_0378826 [Tanacetum coccineum]
MKMLQANKSISRNYILPAVQADVYLDNQHDPYLEMLSVQLKNPSDTIVLRSKHLYTLGFNPISEARSNRKELAHIVIGNSANILEISDDEDCSEGNFNNLRYQLLGDGGHLAHCFEEGEPLIQRRTWSNYIPSIVSSDFRAGRSTLGGGMSNSSNNGLNNISQSVLEGGTNGIEGGGFGTTISGHMLGAAGVQIPENNLDDLHSSREEDGTLETLDYQD